MSDPSSPDSPITDHLAYLLAQANPDDPSLDELQKRYPGAVARDAGPARQQPTELDALVAYLQVLGTMVDFKLYDAKKDLR